MNTPTMMAIAPLILVLFSILVLVWMRVVAWWSARHIKAVVVAIRSTINLAERAWVVARSVRAPGAAVGEGSPVGMSEVVRAWYIRVCGARSGLASFNSGRLGADVHRVHQDAIAGRLLRVGCVSSPHGLLSGAGLRCVRSRRGSAFSFVCARAGATPNLPVAAGFGSDSQRASARSVAASAACQWCPGTSAVSHDRGGRITSADSAPALKFIKSDKATEQVFLEAKRLVSGGVR